MGLTHITNELALANIRDHVFLLLISLFDHCSRHQSLTSNPSFLSSLGPGTAQPETHVVLSVGESLVMVNATPGGLRASEKAAGGRMGWKSTTEQMKRGSLEFWPQ